MQHGAGTCEETSVSSYFAIMVSKLKKADTDGPGLQERKECVLFVLAWGGGTLGFLGPVK